MPDQIEPMCAALGAQATLRLFADADHSFHVPARSGRTDGQVMCSVRDNGVGFDSSGLPSRSDEQGLGLIGMRERLNALGGTFEIRTAPGSGTELEIKVPLER